MDGNSVAPSPAPGAPPRAAQSGAPGTRAAASDGAADRDGVEVGAGDLATVGVRVDDLSGPEIGALLATHAALMEEVTPAGSCHYLPLAGLAVPEVTMWTAWENGELLGCGALKDLGGEGEIKSMHTAVAHRGRGIGALILAVILAEARARRYRRVSLETGSAPAFAPARALYERHGFSACGPFGPYKPDPHSAFFTLALAE